MEGYHELNAEPVASSARVLRTLLRERLGFGGVLVTDWAEIKNLHAYHKAMLRARLRARAMARVRVRARVRVALTLGLG